MFLVSCYESFGYSHEQTLNSSFVLLLGMLKEYAFLLNTRKKMEQKTTSNLKQKDDDQYIEMFDFETGVRKKVKKVDSI